MLIYFIKIDFYKPFLNKAITMPSNKQVIILPVAGEPYIALDKSDDMVDLQEIVGGSLHNIYSRSFIIDPIFEEEPHWVEVDYLLKNLRKNQYSIFVNKNASQENLPNNMPCSNCFNKLRPFPAM